MSKAWAKGSSTRWRRARARVLARDNYQCQLQLPGCTGSAPLRGGHVHHVLGKAHGDDNLEALVASCRNCNLKAGQPSGDPAPRPNTNW